jgi:hypothetical protein
MIVNKVPEITPNRFDYVQYDEYAQADQAEFKAAFIYLETLIENLTNGRAKSLALTASEEAYMWVGKAIRDEQIERNRLTTLQEDRSNS